MTTTSNHKTYRVVFIFTYTKMVVKKEKVVKKVEKKVEVKKLDPKLEISAKLDIVLLNAITKHDRKTLTKDEVMAVINSVL